MKEPHKLQIINKLTTTKPLIAISLLMRNFTANFGRVPGICKDFAGNRLNELGNVPRCGIVPKFSDFTYNNSDCHYKPLINEYNFYVFMIFLLSLKNINVAINCARIRAKGKVPVITGKGNHKGHRRSERCG